MEIADRRAASRGESAIHEAKNNPRLEIGAGLKLYCQLYFTGPGRLRRIFTSAWSPCAIESTAS